MRVDFSNFKNFKNKKLVVFCSDRGTDRDEVVDLLFKAQEDEDDEMENLKYKDLLFYLRKIADYYDIKVYEKEKQIMGKQLSW